MSESLFPHYERELLFLRQMSQEFARLYPGAASRLLLEANRSVDPHVERMIQSFALLTARIQHKLEDEFPELTESMLNILYPHFLSPIPSMAIVEFVLDAQRGPLPDGFVIERGSKLRAQPISDVAARYRTTYPVTLWPIAITQGQLMPPPFPPGFKPPPGASSALILKLDVQSGLKFTDLSLDKLRLFMTGEGPAVAALYELLFNSVLQVVFRPGDGDSKLAPVVLPPNTLEPVGFERDEGMLPYPKRAFLGYRLLTEFFNFPYKFHFVDVGGFQRLKQAGFQKKAELVLFLNRHVPSLQQAVDAQTFRLGCTPIVNLFDRLAEPIALTHTRTEYQVLPDVSLPHGLEVYSVNEITCIDPVTGEGRDVQPFYSYRHGITQETQQMFWYATRRQSSKANDKGTDVYLNLIDLGFRPVHPAEATLAVRITCTNRQIPALLQRFADQLRLELEGAAPLAALRCLRRPTVPIQPPLKRGAHWRLISQLALNHLSIVDKEAGRDALQEILRVYDFSEESGDQQSAVARNLVDGILSVDHRRVVGRVGPRGIAQGVEVSIEFDEQKYVGTGVFLFASILERFLGAYASLNSFTQLVAKTRQGEGHFKKWPPRAGEKPLI